MKQAVIWNATNDYGKPVSAGVYLYGYAKHKRSKISADFPTLTKQIAEVPKSLELVEGVQIQGYNEDERLS